MYDREIRLNIADVVVSLTVEAGVPLVGHVDSFLVDAPADAMVNVQLNHGEPRAQNWHRLAIGEKLGWNAYQTVDGASSLVERLDGQILVRLPPGPGCDLVEVLLGAPDCASHRDSESSGREFLLVEVLPLPVVALLAGRNGLFLHSCAVSLAERGILFSGVSGSGKSTMAGLWRRFGPDSSAVIDDEHILARQVSGSTMVYGAPWSRGPRRASFSRTPLRAVFFLSHGARNRCIRLSPGEALADLLSQVFLPVWNREQFGLVMQTCADLLRQVQCYRLQFVPDQEVVAFVQDVLGVS